jgi:hypothetical protein
MRNITHIGALCSHGTKNNQHNSSTQPQTNRAPCPTATSAATTRSTGGSGPRWQTRCVVGTAPRPHVLWQWTAPRPHMLWQPWRQAHLGQRSPPPVTVTKHTWLTKRPYNKRQKKSHVPVPVPQAAVPAAAPAPVPLVAVDKAAAPAPVEMKPPPVLPAALAVAPVPFLLDKPIHPSSILVEIVGTEMSFQGRSCEEHKICGEVLAMLTRSSDAAARTVIPSACIRFEAATRPRFLRAV